MKARFYFVPTPSVYPHRYAAGQALIPFSQHIIEEGNMDLFAIPCSGIPVAQGLMNLRNLRSVRCLPIAKLRFKECSPIGFGALSGTGEILLNLKKIQDFAIEPSMQALSITEAKERVHCILESPLCRIGKKGQNKKNIALIVDDGTSTGYTAVIGYKFVKKLNYKHIYFIIPVVSKEAFDFINKNAPDTKIISLISPIGPSYLIDDYFEDDSDVRRLYEMLNITQEII